MTAVPEFWYEALDTTGRVQQGTMTATDEGEVEERLRADGTYLVRAGVRVPRRVARTDGKIDRKQILALLEYMAGGAQVGMPMLTTLIDVQPRLESKKLRKIVGEMRLAMEEEGKGLSEAMAEHPKAFPPYYVSTIEAGEASGQLDYVLRQLVEHLDWQENIGSQFKQAITYPLIIVVAISVLLVVLVGFVFPRIVPTLTGRGGEIPLPTQIVIASSNFIRAWWLETLILFAVGGAAVAFMRRHLTGGVLIDRFILRIPGVGQLVLQSNMARLVTYLSLFYRSGVEFIYSLHLIERLMGNRAVAASVRRTREAVIGGSTIAAAFSRDPIFPPIVVRSIALGESTGHLDQALDRAAAFYAREVPAAVRRAVTILQPALIAIMGGAVLLVGLGIIMPILGIYETIGRRR